MKNTPQFKTKSGRLTAYALACGYVERAERDNGNRVSLFHEHGVYHVNGLVEGEPFSSSFRILANAIRFFNSLS